MDNLSAVRVLEVDDNRAVATLRDGTIAGKFGASGRDRRRWVGGDSQSARPSTGRRHHGRLDAPAERVGSLREIGSLVPAARILIVSNEADPAIVQAAFAAGARGYVLKSLAAGDLLKAIEAIVRGDLFIGRGLTES